MKTLPKDERETIISRMDDEDAWNVYTCAIPMRDHMIALAKKHHLKLVEVDEYGIEVTVPKAWVSIRPPRRVSEEEREARRLRVQGRPGWGRRSAGAAAKNQKVGIVVEGTPGI